MPLWHTNQELTLMPHAYTTDQLVEQPAIGLVAALGWQIIGPLDLLKLDIETA